MSSGDLKPIPNLTTNRKTVFEENALEDAENLERKTQTETLPDKQDQAEASMEKPAEDLENNFDRQPAAAQQSSTFDSDESEDETDDDGDDPFALPSQKPQMAAPMKVKQKKKKRLFPVPLVVWKKINQEVGSG